MLGRFRQARDLIYLLFVPDICLGWTSKTLITDFFFFFFFIRFLLQFHFFNCICFFIPPSLFLQTSTQYCANLLLKKFKLIKYWLSVGLLKPLYFTWLQNKGMVCENCTNSEISVTHRFNPNYLIFFCLKSCGMKSFSFMQRLGKTKGSHNLKPLHSIVGEWNMLLNHFKYKVQRILYGLSHHYSLTNK